MSNARYTSYGVPQGSVLGPLLFLVYINDMPKAINNPLILFADDSTIVFNNEQEIKNGLNEIIQWLQANNLIINLDKTKIMKFQQKEKNELESGFHCQDTEIGLTNEAKFLGLHIQSNLKWNAHLEHICSKLNTFSYALRKLTKQVNRETVIVSYHGQVAATLRYGIIF